MKPYGMLRRDHLDVDVRGCVEHGRATGVYALPKHGGAAGATRSLREGKKASHRRLAKRRARVESRSLCVVE